MPAITPPVSKGAAIEEALRAYLQSHTGISWGNYSNIVSPGNDPIALARVYREGDRSKLPQDWYAQVQAYGALRMLMAGTEATTIERSLKNWRAFLSDILKQLPHINGVSGTYVGLQLSQELKSFQISEKGWSLNLSEYPQTDSAITLYQASLSAEFTFNYSE